MLHLKMKFENPKALEAVKGTKTQPSIRYGKAISND